ncbi:MAG: hypothetical protein J6O04_00570 [Selenomonadaceae bacterium]|nr:hypothetical protein [Selenomonadaceae bacterium]
MNGDLISLINFIKSHSSVYCIGTSNYVGEILSFCIDNGVKIDAFVQPGDAPEGATYFGVPVYGTNHVPVAPNCGWIVATGNAGAAEMFMMLQRSGIYDSFLVTESMIGEMVRIALSPNLELKGAADSERCFLLLNGPSTNKQDLLKLKNETVFACNSGFNMSRYHDISPKYHVSASVVNEMHGDKFNYEYGALLNEKITSKIIFRDYYDRLHLQHAGDFKDKQIFYLLQNLNWDNNRVIPDLTGSTPIIWNISVMMLKIALYMGFRKIYLLGVELDSFNKIYEHSYDVEDYPEHLQHWFLKEKYESSGVSMYKKLQSTAYVFSEFQYIYDIARANGIEIYNATIGGIVDVFPRVEYESLFN